MSVAAKRSTKGAAPGPGPAAKGPTRGKLGWAHTVWPVDDLGPLARKATERLLQASAVDRALAVVPPLSLVALEVMSESGGGAVEAELVLEVEARCGASRKLSLRALEAMREIPLCVLLTVGSSRAWMLTDCVAEQVSRAVVGITLPDPPTDDGTPEPALEQLRERGARIAALGLLAHRQIKIGQYGSVHRGSVNALAKAVNGDPATIDQWIEDAVSNGWLRARGQVVGPTLKGLLEAAEAGPWHPRSLPIRMVQWLSSAGREWVSFEALIRAEMRTRDKVQLEGATVPRGLPGSRDRQELCALLQSTESLEAREVAKRRFVRPWTAPEARELHVTPSYEVIAGPRTALSALAVVSLGCELKRIDAALTFAITAKSVSTGVAAGVSADGLISALEGASRHPIPGNVAHSIRDWAARARIGRVTEALLVRGPPEALDAVALSHSSFVVERLMPELLALELATPLEALTDVFKTHDVVLGAGMSVHSAANRKLAERYGPLSSHLRADFRDETSFDDEGDFDDDDPTAEALKRGRYRREARAAAPPECPLPLRFAGNEALRVRLREDVRLGFKTSERALASFERSPDSGNASAKPPSAAPSSVRLDPFDPLVMNARHWLRSALSQLEAWLKTLPATERAAYCRESLPGFLWLFLMAPKARQAVLNRSRSLAALTQRMTAGQPCEEAMEFFEPLMERYVHDPDQLTELVLALLPPPLPSAPANPSSPPPSAPVAAPATPGAVSAPASIRDWMGARTAGERVWLELTTAEGLLRSTFLVDKVQTRGSAVSLLVSSEELPQGRVVNAADIMSARTVSPEQ